MRIAFISDYNLQEASCLSTPLYSIMEELQGLVTCDWINDQAISIIRYFQEEYGVEYLNDDVFQANLNEMRTNLLKRYPYKVVFTDTMQNKSFSDLNCPVFFVASNAVSTIFQSLSSQKKYMFSTKRLSQYLMNNLDKMVTEGAVIVPDIPINVYAVNLRSRLDRRKHIISQFKGREEFDFTLLDAIESESAKLGLWKSLCLTVQKAKERKLDYFIFCEDDHIFTPHYNAAYLRKNIEGAFKQKSDILCGGIGGTDIAIPISKNRFCIGEFYCTQFVVIFSNLYDTILEYSFQEGDTTDGVLSVIAKSKMTIYPFVSTQRSFGYSDVTPQNNYYNIENYFRVTDDYLSKLHKISLHYNYPWSI